ESHSCRVSMITQISPLRSSKNPPLPRGLSSPSPPAGLLVSSPSAGRPLLGLSGGGPGGGGEVGWSRRPPASPENASSARRLHLRPGLGIGLAAGQQPRPALLPQHAATPLT